MKLITGHKSLFLFLLALTINHCRTSPVLQAADTPIQADPPAMTGDPNTVRAYNVGDPSYRVNEPDELGSCTGTWIPHQDWNPLESDQKVQVILEAEFEFHGLLAFYDRQVIQEVNAPAVIH